MRAATFTALTIVALAALFAATWRERSGDASFRRLRDADTIRIGYAVEPPFAYLKEDGTVSGESPEVAKRVLARLGLHHIVWVQTSFDALIPGLESRRFDVVAAGLFITPERAARVTFSEPTFHVRPALLVRKDNPRHLASYRDAVADKHIRIALLDGAVEEELMRSLGCTEPSLIVVPDALTGRVAVASGTADALALSSPSVRWVATHEASSVTDAVLAAPPRMSASMQQTGYRSSAFHSADRSPLAAWNGALRGWTGSPEHYAILERFGFDRSELPGSAMSTEVLTR